MAEISGGDGGGLGTRTGTAVDPVGAIVGSVGAIVGSVGAIVGSVGAIMGPVGATIDPVAVMMAPVGAIVGPVGAIVGPVASEDEVMILCICGGRVVNEVPVDEDTISVLMPEGERVKLEGTGPVGPVGPIDVYNSE